MATGLRREVAPFARRRAAALLAGLGLALLLGAGWLWVRDAGLFRVRDVRVSGLASSEAAEVREALREAGREMTTLHVREDALRAAVRGYASVARLDVDADLPHALRIEVVERAPVAVVSAGGAGVPATGGGLLLRGLRPPPGLPTVGLPTLPAGGRVRDRGALAALAVAAAAPAELRARVARVGHGDRGLVLALREGPELVFGSQAQARTKWLAAARVLADPSAAGATYLDLRVPERVAAGGVGPLEPEDESDPQATP